LYNTKPIPASTKNNKPLSIGMQGGGQHVGLLVVGGGGGTVPKLTKLKNAVITKTRKSFNDFIYLRKLKYIKNC
jgi:hypothetical protein